MSRVKAVYEAKNGDKHVLQFAVSSDNKVYRREFKRHTRFGTKFDTWKVASVSDIMSEGFDMFRRIDKEIKVVLPFD